MLAFALPASAAEFQPVDKSSVIVFINGKKYYVHTVKSGDTLYSIAKAYGVTEAQLKEVNPNCADGLRIDQTIKIPVSEKALADARGDKRRKKDYVTHKIKAGQTLYSIARDYNISVSTLREDNPTINPQALVVGETLWVRKAGMGSSSEDEAKSQMQEYAETLNKATDDGYEYHVVMPGETIYSLSRRYGISEKEFAELNDVSNGLKAGAVIRVRESQQDNTKLIDNANTIAENAVVEAQANEANVVFNSLSSDQLLNIALMLPMSVNGRPNVSYVEFYQGFLLGLEDVKQNHNGKTQLTVYDTEHDPLKVQRIVGSEIFKGTNLIVGPVYEDELKPALDYGVTHSTPVVSPLADIASTKSPVLYQLSPDPSKKYDKIANLLDGGRDIYLIYAASHDKEFEGEILKVLEGKNYAAYTYSFDQKSIFTPRNAAARQIELIDDILKEEKPCLFIVLANVETDVDRILGTLSSAKVALTDRSEKCAAYTVLGNSRWSRFANIDPTTYFNNNVVMISTYHAKRDAANVREFDSRYLEAYGTFPSLYAYRGYDSAVMFGAGMRSDIEYNMLDKRYKPLQTEYKFVQDGAGGKYINQSWMRVNYNSNYTITTE